MSNMRHVVVQGMTRNAETEQWEDILWVFGWDPPLMTFFLQKHDALLEDKDENPILWLGATADTQMYEVEDLVKVARKHGLEIDYETPVKLYGGKNEGV